MAQKSEKGFVLRWIIGCLAAILIFHFAWAPYLFINWVHNGVFTVIDALIFIAFTGSSYMAYENADDPNYDYMRKLFVAMSVLSSIWAAAWSTGLMNNLSQGI